MGSAVWGKIRSARPGICVLLLAAGTSACALFDGNGGAAVVRDCVIPSDQTGTISGHWKVTPIPIALHAGDFAADEATDITSAADSWNNFYKSSLGMTQVLNYGSDPTNPQTSSATKPSQLCSGGILAGTQFSGNVVIYKDGRWPYANLPNAIALTSFCPVPGTPLNSFFMAIMEVNYQNFFVQGQKLPDLQSIVLHELGHLLGLNHSCEGFNKTGTPNCNESNLPNDYVAASLFPVFSFDQTGVGQQKRTLQSNDEGRANCLYINGGTGSNVSQTNTTTGTTGTTGVTGATGTSN